jgi:flagellin
MFTRVKELGIQRSGTSDSDAIAAIDSELSQILKEVDNIETNTEYNGDKLFDGSGSFSIYTDINGSTTSLDIDELNLVHVANDAHSAAAAVTATDTHMFSVDQNYGLTGADSTNLGSEIFVHETTDLLDLKYTTATGLGVQTEASDGGNDTTEGSMFTTLAANTAGTGGNISSDDNMFVQGAGDGLLDNDADEDRSLITQDQLSTNIVKGATAAINKVATIRGQIGSYQNRFEASIRNFEGTAENLQAAESRIRDVDMAKEMVGFTKDTIIQQAAQAMLVQANQLPQNIVGLLR